MKILISADMEGATGVTWSDDCEPGNPRWERCRPMFTGDVNATIEGLYAGGATEVVVNEAHATMRNLLLERLDERASMITGRHKDLSMVEGIQSGDFDGVVFLGYHCGAGEEGVLAHTYLPNSLTGVWLNGNPASEGVLNAAVAAEFGTPVILVTGDDRACADADRYAPDARRAAVKDYVSRYAALCRTPAQTFRDIRAAAEEAAPLARRHAPVAGGPFTVDVEVDAAHLAGAAAVIPDVERTGARTVRYTCDTAYDMIRCFKAVTTLISGAVEANYG